LSSDRKASGRNLLYKANREEKGKEKGVTKEIPADERRKKLVRESAHEGRGCQQKYWGGPKSTNVDTETAVPRPG